MGAWGFRLGDYAGGFQVQAAGGEEEAGSH